MEKQLLPSISSWRKQLLFLMSGPADISRLACHVGVVEVVDVAWAQVDGAEVFGAGDGGQAAPVLLVIRVEGAEHVVQGAEVRAGLGADRAPGRGGVPCRG